MPRAKKSFRRANGDGTVYNLGGTRRNPWVAKYPICTEYDEALKRGYRQLYTTIGYYESKDDAQLALINYKKGNEKREINKLTFAEVYEGMKKMVFPSIGSEAQEKYEWAYNKYKNIHKSIFCNIGLFELQDVMDSLNLKKESKQKIKSVIKAMYIYAIPRNIVNTNYASFITVNTDIITHERLHKRFTNQELEILWKNTNIKDIDTILLMIYMGYRVSEMLGIKISDIDLKVGYIKGGNKTNAGKNKIVPIPDKLLKFIKNRYDVNSDYLIHNIDNKKYDYDHYRVYIFNKIMDKLNMQHTTHDCRHTFTSLLSDVNENPTTIKKLVGHKNFKITEEVYIHKNIEQLKDAINKI